MRRELKQMETTIWDFREEADKKAELYEFYHLNSEHTARTQSFNAPKMDYKLPEITEEERETVWTVPYLEDIPDDGFTLKDALMKRRTSWDFHREPLTDAELEKYLAYSFGINDKAQNLKTYPSGGRLYPVEIYLIPTQKIVGKNRIFAKDYSLKYNMHTRRLEKQARSDTDKADTLISATDIGPFTFAQAQFLTCLAGNPEVMKKKYHALTYRLMHDECGHIGQNMMLAAGMMDLCVVPLGGFFEERIRKLLNIAGTEKRVLYVLAVG